MDHGRAASVEHSDVTIEPVGGFEDGDTIIVKAAPGEIAGSYVLQVTVPGQVAYRHSEVVTTRCIPEQFAKQLVHQIMTGLQSMESEEWTQAAQVRRDSHERTLQGISSVLTQQYREYLRALRVDSAGELTGTNGLTPPVDGDATALPVLDFPVTFAGVVLDFDSPDGLSVHFTPARQVPSNPNIGGCTLSSAGLERLLPFSTREPRDVQCIFDSKTGARHVRWKPHESGEGDTHFPPPSTARLAKFVTECESILASLEDWEVYLARESARASLPPHIWERLAVAETEMHRHACSTFTQEYATRPVEIAEARLNRVIDETDWQAAAQSVLDLELSILRDGIQQGAARLKGLQKAHNDANVEYLEKLGLADRSLRRLGPIGSQMLVDVKAIASFGAKRHGGISSDKQGQGSAGAHVANSSRDGTSEGRLNTTGESEKSTSLKLIEWIQRYQATVLETGCLVSRRKTALGRDCCKRRCVRLLGEALLRTDPSWFPGGPVAMSRKLDRMVQGSFALTTAFISKATTFDHDWDKDRRDATAKVTCTGQRRIRRSGVSAEPKGIRAALGSIICFIRPQIRPIAKVDNLDYEISDKSQEGHAFDEPAPYTPETLLSSDYRLILNVHTRKHHTDQDFDTTISKSIYFLE